MMRTGAQPASNPANIVRRARRQVANHVKLRTSNPTEALQYQNGHISPHKISQFDHGTADWGNPQQSFSADFELQQQHLEVEELREDHDTQVELRLAASEKLSRAISAQESQASSDQDNLFANLYKSTEPAHLLILPNSLNESQTSNIRHRFHGPRQLNYRPSTSWRDETRKQQQQHKAHPSEANNDDVGHPSRRDHSMASGGDDSQASASASDLRLGGAQSESHRTHQARVLHTTGQQRVVGGPSGQTTAASNVITAHRMPEVSYRQAPAISAGSSRTAPLESNTANKQSGTQAAGLANSQVGASGEGQWIPIVTISGHNNANQRANRVSNLAETDTNRAHNPVAQAALSSQASSALLDFPSKPGMASVPPSVPPFAAQNGRQQQQHKTRRPQVQLAPPSDLNQAARPAAVADQRRPVELQQTAASYEPNFGHPHAHAPNFYASDDHQPRQQQRPRHHESRRPRHRHHHNHQHWRQLDPPPAAYHHRRPRLSSQHENSIEHDAIEFRPNKIYKRVLLCDKTLVSLDYIRNLEAEPRPGGVNEFVNEHELNEIADNFISGELDGAYEMIARSGSNPVESPAPTLARQNSSDTQRVARALVNATSNELALETSESHAAALMLDRRALLSDQDPLVRCDMWDLEKGLKSRKPPEGILRMAVKADFETVRDAINRCRQLSERTLPPDDEFRDGLEIMSSEDLLSLFSVKRGLIPGTKWCGLGDQANSYNDLGQKHRIDICCRAHDHCPIRSKPFRNDYGILNIGLYTKSHCDCDADFYRCLREVRSRTADMLGNLYFNVMKLQCMREERLKICSEMKPIALGFERCIRYEESPYKRVFKFTTPPVAY